MKKKVTEGDIQAQTRNLRESLENIAKDIDWLRRRGCLVEFEDHSTERKTSLILKVWREVE